MEGTRVLTSARAAAVKHMFVHGNLKAGCVDAVLFGQAAMGKSPWGQGLGDGPVL